MRLPDSPTGPLRLLHVVTVPMSLHFVRGQAAYMRTRGFDVHALCAPDDGLAQFSHRTGISTLAVSMTRGFSPLEDLKSLAMLYRHIRRLGPAIVHAQTPKAGLLGMLAAALARVPVRVYHMRGLPMTSATGLTRALLRQWERAACALAHRVVCVSHSIRAVAIDERVCAADKIRVLHHGSGQGVDAEGRFDPGGLSATVRHDTRRRLHIPADAHVVGFVGRIARDKGLGELAQAWRTIRVGSRDAYLLIVGPFEDRDRIPSEVEDEWRRDPRVRTVGLDWNTPPLYASMDVVVLPSYREGFPNVALEAAAMALPVVATQVPGCVDAVVHDVTGTLVPVRDAAAIASVVLRYLGDPELRRRHGTAGRRRALSDFRPEAVWEAMHGEYLRLLAAAGQITQASNASGRLPLVSTNPHD